MIVRSAVLEGTIEGADRERFAHHMRQVVLPAIAQYPRIRDVQLRETIELDPEAPLVRFVFDLYFDSLEDMRDGVGEQPIASADRERPDRVLAGIVVERVVAVGEEARERGPLLGEVVQRLTEQAAGQDGVLMYQ